MIQNLNCIKKRFKESIAHYIFLVLDAFYHVQTTFNTIFSKYNPTKSIKSPTPSPSESQVSSFKIFKSDKVHYKKINLKFQASEKIHFIESDDQNRTRSGKIERSISLEVNKTEFWSVNSE